MPGFLRILFRNYVIDLILKQRVITRTFIQFLNFKIIYVVKSKPAYAAWLACIAFHAMLTKPYSNHYHPLGRFPLYYSMK